MKKEGNVLRLPGLELKWLYGYKLSTPYHFSARDEIRKMQLDLIHVHTEFGVGMFGRIVAKYLNIPVVTTYHTMYEDYTHYVNRFEIDEVDKVTKKVVSTFSRSISDSAQAVISPSEKTKETLLKYGVKTPIYVIPTGLNFEKFHPDNIDPARVQEIRRQYGIQEDERLIVFVGRIAQEKSIEIPIEGFRYVSDTKIKLMIVGGGPKLVQRHHLERQVIFTDKKLPEEIPAYYACADCFVSASLTETQGMTYIEALASGLPAVCRRDDCLNDVITNGKNGGQYTDFKEFSELIRTFLFNDELYKSMSENAVQTAQKYSAEKFAKDVETVYMEILEKRNHYEITNTFYNCENCS